MAPIAPVASLLEAAEVKLTFWGGARFVLVNTTADRQKTIAGQAFTKYSVVL
jgi:hypothetical protein